MGFSSPGNEKEQFAFVGEGRKESYPKFLHLFYLKIADPMILLIFISLSPNILVYDSQIIQYSQMSKFLIVCGKHFSKNSINKVEIL
jgi:hypothetical protein